MKIHLHRSDRSTWCGREIQTLRFGKGVKPSNVTRYRLEVTCQMCLKADAAEERRER